MKLISFLRKVNLKILLFYSADQWSKCNYEYIGWFYTILYYYTLHTFRTGRGVLWFTLCMLTHCNFVSLFNKWQPHNEFQNWFFRRKNSNQRKVCIKFWLTSWGKSEITCCLAPVQRLDMMSLKWITYDKIQKIKRRLFNITSLMSTIELQTSQRSSDTYWNNDELLLIEFFHISRTHLKESQAGETNNTKPKSNTYGREPGSRFSWLRIDKRIVLWRVVESLLCIFFWRVLLVVAFRFVRSCFFHNDCHRLIVQN